MKTMTLLIIILLFVVFPGYPQPEKSVADSLARLIALSGKEDSNKVKLLLDYGKCMIAKQPDTTLVISEHALKIAFQIGFGYGIVRGLNNIAICYWYKNNPDKAIPTFHEALSRAVKDKNIFLEGMVSNNLGAYYNMLGVSDSALKYNLIAVNVYKKLQNKERYAKANSDLAMVYYNKGNYVEALECLIEAKNYYESCHLLFDLDVTYVRLGLLYYSIRDFEKSISYFRKALVLNKSVKDTDLEMKILQNTGILYSEVKKDVDSARIFLLKALQMARENNSHETILAALVNLGNIALLQEDYKQAISLYNEAFKSPLVPYHNQERAAILVNLGKAYLNLGDLAMAEKYAIKGIKLAQEQKFVLFERTASKILGDIEAKKKNYKGALDYYIRYSNLLDTVGNDEVKQKMVELVFRNTLKMKENENILLQKDNQIKQQTIYDQRLLMAAIGVIMLLLVILLAVIARNSRKKQAMNQVLDQKNRELNELNLTKDKFFSIISHDLKSPFNGLLGLLTELDTNYDDLDEGSKRHIIGSLKRSSHNTFNLLENLLDWARSQNGQIRCVPQETFPYEVAKEVFVILLARATAKNQILVNEIESGIKIYSDPQIIQAMLLNLVNNSIKFTLPNGTITVRTRFSDGFLCIEVSDTGIGIPASEVPNLFRIDAQYKCRGTENEPGTGLGLVMCKEFATILGGEIGVQSEQGKGSVFYFTIPVSADPAKNQTAI